MDCSIDITISERKLARFDPQKDLCAACYKYTEAMFRSLGLIIHRYSDFLSAEEFTLAQEIAQTIDCTKISDFKLNGIAVGEHSMAGALRLLIRVHPAEIWGMNPSRQKVADEIKKVFPVLSKNVFIIPPQARISIYATMLQCNAVIIYGTKRGVELASMGIPVIVAGEAWVRNKGITMDAVSGTHYYTLLDTLTLEKPLDESTVIRARKYAYHFFSVV